MSSLWVEVLIVILLILINGVFAMSEMAVVSARKARLQQLVNEGHSKAGMVLEIANAPGTFLSTIQIGITLIGILAGAYGGTTIAGPISSFLLEMPVVGPYHEIISLVVVVIVITYFSLIIGELVPKRIGLNNSEAISMRVVKPLRTLSYMALPLVHLLNLSTNFILSILRIKPSSEPSVTEEEVKILIEQGTQTGVFNELEQDMVECVFRLGDRKVNNIMTARPDIVFLNLDSAPELNWRKISISRHSDFPVYQGNEDNIIGIASIKTLWANLSTGQPVDLRKSLEKPLFVPENMPAMDLLETLRQQGLHMALIVDEYGTLQGIATPDDIFKSIVGIQGFAHSPDAVRAVQRKDGSWLLDGGLAIDELRSLFDLVSIPGEEEGQFNTLGGFIMTYLGRIPEVTDQFDWSELRFEIVDMDGRRVDKVLVTLLNSESE